MSSSPSLVAAATTLAAWAHERRRVWSADPLAPPSRRVAVELAPDVLMHDAIELRADDVLSAIPPAHLPPSVAVLDVALAAARRAGAEAITLLERLRPLGDSAAEWLMRGAAVASTMSVVLLIAVNHEEVVARWDSLTAMVAAATNRPAAISVPAGPPKGTGRLSVASANGAAQIVVDGKPRGFAPATLDLPAGAHTVVLTSDKGSVERSVTIRAGESSDLSEAIFSGWVALTTPIDVTLSEGGRVLKRDDRGWAILAPGPHEIHFDNGLLGVHEVRSVVITPGDATRLSYAPPASTVSLTTNEVAEVWIDGVAAGQTPVVDQPIAIGLHDVRVRSAAHERWLRVRVTVQPSRLNVDLQDPAAAGDGP